MAYIKAISYYLPEKIITNSDLLEKFPEWSDKKIADKIGVKQRHVAAPDETACDMGYQAALKLFKENNINPASIDFILFCSQSPDYLLPSTACILQNKLGLPTNAGAFDYNLGCSGCIYGLAIAKGLLSAGIAENILLITSETYTKYLHPDDISNKTIFGDGAAACLISSTGFAKIGDFELGTDGSGAEDLIVKTGGARYPNPSGLSITDEEERLKHDDYLYMKGSAIFNFTIENVPQMLTDLYLKNNISEEKVNYFIFHQANKYMLNILRKFCNIPSEKFYIDLETTGNTVSSTILIGIKDCIDKNIIKRGDKVVIAGFGVGLSWGATILDFT